MWLYSSSSAVRIEFPHGYSKSPHRIPGWINTWRWSGWQKLMKNFFGMAHGSVTIPKSSEWIDSRCSGGSRTCKPAFGRFPPTEWTFIGMRLRLSLLHLVDLLALFCRRWPLPCGLLCRRKCCICRPFVLFLPSCVSASDGENGMRRATDHYRHFISTIPHVVLNATGTHGIKALTPLHN